MIKVFRRLRQSLIKEGNLKRYFLYALGEILLIVIGILIAIQISNINEANKIKRIEILSLSEIRTDLLITLEDLNNDLRRHIDRMAKTRFIFKYITENDTYQDSLDTYFTVINQDYQLFPKKGAYESLRSRGFQILSNDSLRLKITDLYQLNLQRVYTAGVDNTINRNIIHYLEPYMYKYFSLTNIPLEQLDVPFSKEPLPLYKFHLNDYDLLRADASFLMTLQSVMIIRRKKIRDHLYLKNQIESILKDIDKDLERLT